MSEAGNITPYMVKVFQAITSGDPGVTLWSCSVNGEPTVAIVAVRQLRRNAVEVMPLFVAVTPDMEIELEGQGGCSGGGGSKRPKDEFKAAGFDATAPEPS